VSLPPVVAELRANIGDYMSKMRGAREEWERTGATLGESTGVRAAEGHLHNLSRTTGESVSSTRALAETSRESFTAMRTGLSTVVPGFGELAGTLGVVGGHFREVRAAGAEALERTREHGAALKLQLERVTVAQDALLRKMVDIDPASAAFTRANDKALAYTATIARLNAELAATAAEERKLSGGSIGGKVGKVGKVGAVGAAGLLAVGVAVGGAVSYEGVKLAMQEQAQLELLRNAVSKTRTEWDKYEPALDNVTKQMRRLGYADGETMASAQRLTSALHDPEKALNLTGLAANIARARNIDLATATGYVAKVATGHVGTLGRMGLASTDAAGKTYTTKQAIDALGKAYGGASEAYSHTLKGQLADLKAQTEHVLVGIGNRLIPVLERFGERVREAAAWVRQHIVPALHELHDWFVAKIVPGLERTATILRDSFGKVLHSLTGDLHKNGDGLRSFAHGVGVVAEFVATKVLPALAKLQGAFWAVEALAIRPLIQAFAYVGQHFRAMVQNAGAATAGLINGFVRPVVAAFLWFAKETIGAAAAALGWVPGLGKALKGAKGAVDAFAKDADASLKSWADSASKWGAEAAASVLNSATLQAQIADAQKRLAAAEATDDPRAIARAQAQLASLTAQLSKLKGTAKPKVKVEPAFDISGNYSDSVTNVVKKAKVKKDSLAELRKKLAAEHKAALERLRAQLKAEADRALAEAARIAAAREAQLKRALAAAQELARQLAVQNALNGSAAGRLDIVDGAFLNRGSSFADFAAQRKGGTVVNVNVQGNVTSEGDLAKAVHDQLLQYGRTNIGTGL
jgi:hypothetical protein